MKPVLCCTIVFADRFGYKTLKKITLFSLCLLEWSVVSSYTVLTVKHTPSFLPGFFELLLENGSLVIFLEEPLNPTTVFPYQKGFQVELFFVS